MFSGEEFSATLVELGITHVVWLPDSTTGQWERALERTAALRLIRICREGEAWPLAAGLLLGQAAPIVVMQSTGLFESGDALRNVVFDLQLPVFALIGARNWLNPDSSDSARRYIRPILDAWGIDYHLIESPAQRSTLGDYYRHVRQANQAGLVVLAEGAG